MKDYLLRLEEPMKIYIKVESAKKGITIREFILQAIIDKINRGE